MLKLKLEWNPSCGPGDIWAEAGVFKLLVFTGPSGGQKYQGAEIMARIHYNSRAIFGDLGPFDTYKEARRAAEQVLLGFFQYVNWVYQDFVVEEPVK